MSCNFNFELINSIMEYIEADFIDNKLFNDISKTMIDSSTNEGRRFNICVNLMLHNNVFNHKNFLKANGDIINLLLAIFQGLFNKIDIDLVKEKLLSYLEEDNENENEYLLKSNRIKVVYNTIEIFNKYSSKGQILHLITPFEKEVDGDIFLRCQFR